MHHIKECQGGEAAFEVTSFLAKNFHVEHRIHGKSFALNLEKAFEHIFNLMQQGLCWVAIQDDEIIGALSIHETSLWWSSDPIYMDGFFYVHPDHRGSGVAEELLELARDAAQKDDKPLMVVAFMSGGEEQKQAFFERNGLKAFGGLYMTE